MRPPGSRSLVRQVASSGTARRGAPRAGTRWWTLERVGALAALALLAPLALVGACASAAIEGGAPAPARRLPDGPVAVIVFAEARAAESAHASSASARLAASVSERLIDAGARGVLEPLRAPVASPCLAEAALDEARAAGAAAALVIEVDAIDLDRTTHHIRDYHDATLSGRARLIDLGDGSLRGRGAATARASRRAAYASSQQALDLAADRLALRLVRAVLGPAATMPPASGATATASGAPGL